jgi:hypothetical protein
VATTIGPTALDDFWQLDFVGPGGNPLCQSVQFAKGHTSQFVRIGLFEFPQDGSYVSPTEFGAYGVTCDIRATLYHHNFGGPVDGPTLFTGWLWDPTSAMWAHIINALGGLGGGSGIFNAVHKTYPAT